MAHKFSEAAARQAIEQAHRNVLLELLRTPVHELLADAQRSASAMDQSLPAFLQELPSTELLLPISIGGPSLRHFSAALEALVRLAQTSKAASHRVS